MQCNYESDHYDSTVLRELEAYELTERINHLKATHRTGRLCPVEDKEDVAQSVLVTLLEAGGPGANVAKLVASKPNLLYRALEKERGRLRRRAKRNGQELFDVAEFVNDASSEFERADLLEAMARRIGLSSTEREFLDLWYVRGIGGKDVADRMRKTPEQVSRIKNRLKNKAMAKLRRGPELLNLLFGRDESAR